MRTALADRSFRLLAAGFLVCGLHVAFLGTHLPGIVASCGLRLMAYGLRLTAYGLPLQYGAWARAVLAGLLAPKTGPVVRVFAAFMGLTFLSIVPPTVGLAAKSFGVSHLATLFGAVMLTHQVGDFLDAWLGGKLFESTGSFDIVWMIDIGLAIAAIGQPPVIGKILTRPGRRTPGASAPSMRALQAGRRAQSQHRPSPILGM